MDRSEEVGQAILDKLGPGFVFDDWKVTHKTIFQALKLEKLGMGLILLLIVLVAAFNIVSNLTMVVADKTREIGILKAMGMTSASVRSSSGRSCCATWIPPLSSRLGRWH